MNIKEFKAFCQKEFYKRGYKKIKSTYYLLGSADILSGIKLQKSYYGPEYYINYFFSIGNFKDVPISLYPSYYDSDISGRVIVMSKTQKYKGEYFETSGIEYEEYTEETLQPYFDKAFNEYILPPVYKGKGFILDNLNKMYYLDLRQDEVMKKLKE